MIIDNKKAFTLVELIVVITILAILGTIAFISLQGYSASSRDSVRLSDVSNMETSLELFHLNAGKYPLPDDYYIVSYSGDTLRYQGEFGETIVSQLSRNLNEIPSDPLTDKKYIFSTANNKNEFEILTLLEGELALNTISQTNAATITVTPRIDGTYNGVFIKTDSNIIPVPSIINSEVEGANLILDNINIKSQIISSGKNIPNIGNVNTATGKLIGLELKEILLPAVDASDTVKASVISLIQEAYIGCIDLANNDIYEYILSVNGESNLANVFNTVLLGKTTTISTNNDTQLNLYASCTGINTPTPFSSTTNYGSCDTPDIIVCAGSGSGYTISACNVGTNLAFTGVNNSETYGSYFQWGRNKGFAYGDTSQRTTQILNSNYDPNNDSLGFVFNATYYPRYDWIVDQDDNLWGDGLNTSLSRQGPCEIDYHIPSNDEWNDIYYTLGGGSDGATLQNILKLPFAGMRHRYRGNVQSQGDGGYGWYWSSSPELTNKYAYDFLISTNLIGPGSNYYRGVGYSVRCIKN